jgi:hypothetical protein
MQVTISNPKARTRENGQKDRFSKSRIYIDVQGETIMDNLMNRKSRPYQQYKALMPMIFELLNIEPKPVAWSQYAGCSCPCSPGFIIKEGDRGVDYWITITYTNTKEPSHESRTS